MYIYCYNIAKTRRNVLSIHVYYWSDNELSMASKSHGYNKACIRLIVDLDFSG